MNPGQPMQLGDLARLEGLYGYDILLPPGIVGVKGHPPEYGYIVRVRQSGTTIERVPPSTKVAWS